MIMKDLFQIHFTMSESDFELSSSDESEEDSLSSSSDEEEMVESKEVEENIIEVEDIGMNNSTEQEPTRKTWNMWDTKRLYPPSSKATSKTWRFGGFLKDTKTGLLVTKETICGLCGLKQNYRHSPTNLDQHVQAAHGLQYEGEGSKSEPKINEFFRTLSSSKYKSDHPKQKAVRRLLGEWVIQSNRPIQAEFRSHSHNDLSIIYTSHGS